MDSRSTDGGIGSVGTESICVVHRPTDDELSVIDLLVPNSARLTYLIAGAARGTSKGEPSPLKRSTLVTVEVALVVLAPKIVSTTDLLWFAPGLELGQAALLPLDQREREEPKEYKTGEEKSALLLSWDVFVEEDDWESLYCRQDGLDPEVDRIRGSFGPLCRRSTEFTDGIWYPSPVFSKIFLLQEPGEGSTGALLQLL